MIDFSHIEPFSTKFEDVSIYIHNFKAKYLNDSVIYGTQQKTGYTEVFESLNVHNYINKKEIVGDIWILFRNQGGDLSSMIMFEGNISAYSETDMDAASIFCKVIQYLFEWIKVYISENNLNEQLGKDFILPDFSYGKDHFQLLRK